MHGYGVYTLVLPVRPIQLEIFSNDVLASELSIRNLHLASLNETW